jgi:hypothetical protein
VSDDRDEAQQQVRLDDLAMARRIYVGAAGASFVIVGLVWTAQGLWGILRFVVPGGAG